MGFPDSCMQLQFQVATIVICFFRLTHTVEFLIHMNSWETNDDLLKFVFMYQVHEQMQQQKEQNKPSKVTSL